MRTSCIGAYELASLRPSRYVREAANELEEQFDYYRALDENVASRFMAAVESTIEFVCSSPYAGPAAGHGYRRRVLGRPFRYKVVYKLRDEELVIAAVWADRRDPADLLARLERIEARGE